MRVHVTHLVPKTLDHADDEVVDDGAHRAQRRDVLARAVVQLDVDRGRVRLREAHGEMGEVFDELACFPSGRLVVFDVVAGWVGCRLANTSWSFDRHYPRLDADFDCIIRSLSAGLNYSVGKPSRLHEHCSSWMSSR